MSPQESEQEPSWVKRCRRRLRPLHANRLRAAALHLMHRLGWHQLRSWLGGLAPRRLLLSLKWLLDERRGSSRRRGEKRLTIAVDISPLWQPLTGIGWYLYRLLEAMAQRDDVRLRLYGPSLVRAGDVVEPQKKLPEGPALELVEHRIPRDFSIARAVCARFLRRRLRRLIAADGNAVLFAPNYLQPPFFHRLPGVEVAVVHDLSVYAVPETMRESTLMQLRQDLESTLERASRVITDSETVKSEIAGLVSRDRIDVVALAPALLVEQPMPTRDAAEIEPAPNGRYVLFVGTLEPRKNLPMLIDAFEKWRLSTTVPAELVLCGGIGWQAEDILRRIEDGRRASWLRYEGYLPDQDLVRLYRGAEWLALPSIYEGFGLPAVEAMAAGVPLLLSDIPVLREVAADAALYAAPTDLAAWVALLTRALSDPQLRAEQAEKASARARIYSWQATADATVASWHRAVEKPR